MLFAIVSGVVYLRTIRSIGFLVAGDAAEAEEARIQKEAEEARLLEEARYELA